MTSIQLLKATFVSSLIVFVSTTFLVGFTYGGSYVYQSFFPPSSLFETNTRVANFSLGEKTVEEAARVLSEETDSWKGTNTVSFLYKDQFSSSSALPLFSFDIDASIQYAKANQIAPLFVTVHDEIITSMLDQLSNDHLSQKVDRELLNNDLQAYARALKQEDLDVNIHDYLLEVHKEGKKQISEVYITNFENSERLQRLASQLDGAIIEPRQTTSFFSLIGEESYPHSYEMSVLASGFYKAILTTNIEIIERHISQSLPEYSEVGFEALVSHPNHDLRLFNPNYISYSIEVKPQNDFISFAIVGVPFEKQYHVEKDEVQTFEPKTVLHFSALVADGEREIINPGQTGLAVTVIRKIVKNNRLLETETISEDFYRPIHRVEIRSLINNKIPSSFNETGISNPNFFEDGKTQDPSNESNTERGGQVENRTEPPDEKIEDDLNLNNDPIKGY